MSALDELLAESGQPGLAELRAGIAHALNANGQTRVLDQQALKPRVHRIALETGEGVRRLVMKWMSPEVAQRNELVARRWLSAGELERHGPMLVAVAAERSGGGSWHAYEDLGDRSLDSPETRDEHVDAAIDVIAGLHRRFVRHPLLPEIRLWGGDLGAHFFESSVKDGVNALEALAESNASVAGLRERLRGLLAGAPERTARLREAGGPETFLHGDLWTTNAVVVPDEDGFAIRLIDWDHAAVGPAAYDLSTFLGRFPAAERPGILTRYRDRLGSALAPDEILNDVFETCELARLANGVIWPAIAAWRGEEAWALERLGELDEWFGALEPLLP